MPLPKFPVAESKVDPLAELRKKVAAGKVSSKPAPKPKQTSSEGRLLVAIATANGHTDAEGWAANVMKIFEKPAK